MIYKKLYITIFTASVALHTQFAFAVGFQKNASNNYKEAFLALCLQPTVSQRYTLEKFAEIYKDKFDDTFCHRMAVDYIEKNGRTIFLPQNKAIRDLSPFQYFVNLESLDVSYNEIQDISMLFRLNKLKKINLEKNNITDISTLSNFPKLESLTVSGNPISDISVFAKLPELLDLNFYATSFKSLDALRGLKKLTGLAFSQGEFKANGDTSYLGNTPLRDEINGLTNLKSLTIMQVPIINFCAISSLMQLERLAAVRANIRDIECLRNFKKITELYLDGNPIQDLRPLENLNNLSWLEIREVPVKSIAPLAKLKYLNILNINHSKVEDASPISGRPNFSNLSTEGTHLRWCSPKDAIDVQKGRSCLNPDGSEKPWWKRLFHF
jgi:Leucine-rich repeat (LRR) protein